MIILLPVVASAQPDDLAQMNQANELYNAAAYDSSLQLYEELLDQGYFSFTLFFNAGNAAYQTNQVGKAILYYEKARKLNPSDQDVSHNLALANKLTVDKGNQTSDSATDRLLGLLARSPNYWSWATIVLATVAGILFCLYLISTSRRNKKLGFVMGCLVSLLSLVCLIFAAVQHASINEKNMAVIMSPSVTLKTAPNETAENAFILHEGSKVEIKSATDEWMEVIYNDGKIGWLPLNEVKVI